MKEKEEPIYERLEAGECLIISRNKEGLLVAFNDNGKVKIRRIPIDE